MNEIFIDQDFGTISIVRNVRARNVIARRKYDHIQLTVPVKFSMSQIQKVFETMKPRLYSLKSKSKFVFVPNVKFQTYSFKLNLEVKPIQNFYMSLKDGLLSIACPLYTNFEDTDTQNIIRESIEKAMRYEAKRLFPQKIDNLANKYQFEYNELKINKSKTRWGSCSSLKNINLSYFCMLLPEYLIDFVILHELCHTKEMNHGVQFWMLLDKVTDGKAKRMTNELKAFAISW